MSSAECYLLGRPIKTFPPNRIPKKICVLRKMMYFHIKLKHTIKESVRFTADALISHFSLGKNEAKVDNIERSIVRLHKKYVALRKNKTKQKSNVLSGQEKQFITSIQGTVTINKNKMIVKPMKIMDTRISETNDINKMNSPTISDIVSDRSELGDVSESNDATYLPSKERT